MMSNINSCSPLVVTHPRSVAGRGAEPQRVGPSHPHQPEPGAAEGDAAERRHLLLRGGQQRGRDQQQHARSSGQMSVE